MTDYRAVADMLKQHVGETISVVWVSGRTFVRTGRLISVTAACRIAMEGHPNCYVNDFTVAIFGPGGEVLFEAEPGGASSALGYIINQALAGG